MSKKKDIPLFLRAMSFRWIIFLLLMGFMIFRISRNPDNLNHWGSVFWFMCLVTTLIGLILAILIHPRTWCSFCPIGTLQNWFGQGKYQLTIDAVRCIECKRCEKHCPFNLAIIKYKEPGKMLNNDCLKCSECIAKCPKDALGWPY